MELTEDYIRQFMIDTLYKDINNGNEFTVMAYGYEDENGNIICPFLDQVNEAIKEEFKNRFK